VVDVGAGLCNIIKLPNNKYVLYDAGGEFDNSGNRTMEQIKEQIPAGSTIELFVLSHTDADHIVAAWQVVRDYKVKKILWTGFERSMVGNEAPTQAYQKLVDALGNHPFTENINLNERDSIIIPEIKMQIGSASFSFLCGFGAPLPEWSLDKSEKLNAVSIVMKLQFGGNSVLFTGDAVGRHRDDPEDALIATEKYLVENASSALPSTIIIAPHHGARNGSSTAFVELVKPEVVIFSAGHKFNHPDERTANKYLQFTSVSHLFRTDRGDDEEGTEWDMGRVHNCNDKRGDDDVHIQLRSNHSYRVFYVVPQAGCSN
jgi:beta-lactamase superfamily II metal-dependent hydrolase